MPTIEVILCFWLPEASQTDVFSPPDNNNDKGENNDGDDKNEDDSDNVES